MKFNIPTALCVLIALALVAFGLVYGTWMGFSEEQAEVNALLKTENGLMDVLSYRAADGLNLCVVAKRHLTAGDADLAALEQHARALQQSADLAARRQSDADMTAAAAGVSEKLRGTISFQQSQRDQRYLEMLLSDMNSLKTSAAVDTYNVAAGVFNQKLETLPGRLAALLGVDACPLYQ